MRVVPRACFATASDVSGSSMSAIDLRGKLRRNRRNVMTFARLATATARAAFRASIGSTPAAACLRADRAASRASASPTEHRAPETHFASPPVGRRTATPRTSLAAVDAARYLQIEAATIGIEARRLRGRDRARTQSVNGRHGRLLNIYAERICHPRFYPRICGRLRRTSTHNHSCNREENYSKSSTNEHVHEQGRTPANSELESSLSATFLCSTGRV